MIRRKYVRKSGVCINNKCDEHKEYMGNQVSSSFKSVPGSNTDYKILSVNNLQNKFPNPENSFLSYAKYVPGQQC